MSALVELRHILAGEDCNPEWELTCRCFISEHRAELLRALESVPELVTALRDVLGWIPNGGPWHTREPLESVARAHAAIAKATGASA